MQKWLSVVVLTLAVMVAAMGVRNMTVKASSGNTQVALAAWGGTPLPPTPWIKAQWGGTPLPPTPWVKAKWGGTPLPPTPWMR
jgi:hypothetical protein